MEYLEARKSLPRENFVSTNFLTNITNITNTFLCGASNSECYQVVVAE
jgi:hypothetical protein